MKPLLQIWENGSQCCLNGSGKWNAQIRCKATSEGYIECREVFNLPGYLFGLAEFKLFSNYISSFSHSQLFFSSGKTHFSCSSCSVISIRNGNVNDIENLPDETFASIFKLASMALGVSSGQTAVGSVVVRHWMAFHFIITHRCSCICIQICSTCITVWETMKPQQTPARGRSCLAAATQPRARRHT